MACTDGFRGLLDLLSGRTYSVAKNFIVPKLLVYRTGDEIQSGDRVLLHHAPGEVEFVLDGETNPEQWPAHMYGRGIMIAEPKTFGHIFVPEEHIGTEDIVLVSRSIGRQESSK